MTEYRLFTSPVGFDFDQMTRTEACKFLDHFVAQIPERVPMLEQEVRRCSSLGDWRADGSTESLRDLSYWLERHTDRYDPSDAEREMLRKSISGPLRDVVPEMYFELTPMSYSLARDAAMYLGEIVRRENSGVQWEVGPKPRSNVSYNRPVIATPSRVFAKDPFLVITNMMFGVLRERKAIELARIADEWRSYAKICH